MTNSSRISNNFENLKHMVLEELIWFEFEREYNLNVVRDNANN